MRAIITGQSGLDKEDFFRKILNLVNDKVVRDPEYDQEVKLEQRTLKKAHIDLTIDLEHEMRKQQHNLGSPNYLDIGELALLQSKKETLSDISRRLEPHDVCLLATHLTYYRKSSIYHILDWSSLAKFKPDIIITLVDNVYSVLNRIRSGNRRNDDYVRTISVKDVLWWREVEIAFATILSKHLLRKELPHYIVALRHAPQVVYQLLFESAVAKQSNAKKTVYASFPITKTKGRVELLEKIAQLRHLLKQNFIVFDPLRIDEELLANAYKKSSANDQHQEVRFSKDGRSYSFSSEEVGQARKDIEQQIVSRDERLIEQSDMVVAYHPTLSTGVQHELLWAKRTGRVRTFAIDPNKGKTGHSPFEGEYADRVFGSIDEFAREIVGLTD